MHEGKEIDIEQVRGARDKGGSVEVEDICVNGREQRT
jgi:hypothetical protein